MIKKKKPSQGAFDLGVTKQRPKYIEKGYVRSIRTKELADKMKRDFEKDGYEVKLGSYVVAHQKWWRFTFKR